MPTPYADQITRQPQTHLARKALTTPAGRLKAGVSVGRYLNLMESAAQLDRHGVRGEPIALTNADADRLMESIWRLGRIGAP